LADIFTYSGSTGLQLLTQVIIADITSLRYRGLLSSLMSAPYLINSFVGSNIAASITTANPTNGWRWGYGMFSILVPCTIAPVVITLGWSERRAQKLGLVKVDAAAAIIKDDDRGFFRSVAVFAKDMDVMGLLLLGTGWALLLIALTLSAGANGGWSNREFHCFIPLFYLDAHFVTRQHLSSP
jgi:MFS family permease